MIRYLFSDLKRLVKGYRIYLAVFGVAAAMFFSLEQGIRNSVLESYIVAVIGSGVHIALVFCVFAFGTVFCEDLERKYIYYEVVRGNVWKYVFSKVIVIYLSSIAVILLGTLVFTGICRIFTPWTDKESAYRLTSAGSFGALVLEGHYLLYCLLYSLHLGMFMGTLAVAAAFFSLYISNTVLVLTVPLLLDQLFMELPTNGVFSYLCFEPTSQSYGMEAWNLLSAAILSIIPALLLTAGIYQKMRRRL